MKLSPLFLFLAASLGPLKLFNGLVQAQECTAPFPTLSRPPRRNERAQPLPQKTQFIVPQYKFGCYGQLVKWQARVSGMNPTVIRFQVWRKQQWSDIFELVGENVYPGVAAVKDLVQFDISEDDRISVQPGDIVGVYVESESERDYKIVLHNASVYERVQVYFVEVVDQVVQLFSFARHPLSDGPMFEVRNGSAPLVLPSVVQRDVQVFTSMPAVRPAQTTTGLPARTFLPVTPETTPTPKLPEEGPSNGDNASSKVQTKLIVGISLSTGILLLCLCALIVMVAMYAKVRYIQKTRRSQMNRDSQQDSDRYPSVLTLLPSRETLNSLNDSAPTSLTNSFAEGHNFNMQSTSFQTFQHPGKTSPLPPLPPPPPPTSTTTSSSSSSSSKVEEAVKAERERNEKLSGVSLIKLKENPCYSPLPAAPVGDISHDNGVRLTGKNRAMQNAFSEDKGRRNGDDGRVYDLPIVLNKKSKPVEYEIPMVQPQGSPPETNEHVYAEIH